ncbi:efflux RND transporter periplasmic adaptor subunit [Rhodopila sp.]|uniref:efflux RND transporter periplasmic adaptor subunit n=1 Tax=Rhodopila sp. TaxID=2480087 RepID=UPI003D0AA4A0
MRAAKIAIGVALIAAAGFGLDRVLAPAPIPVAQAAPPVPVVLARVEQGDVPIILSGLGTVQALNSAVIRSQVTGLLQSVDFVEGQQVKRGDRLAQIDPRQEQARLDQAQAQLARDQTQVANIQVNLARNVPLLSKGFATDQQVTDQRSQVVQMQNAVKLDQAVVEDAQTQLGYTSLTAPFDGVTGVRALDVGNIIHPTDASGLVTVTQVQPIAVLFTLPASAITPVQEALEDGAVKAVAYDQTGTRQLDTGMLLLINNEANPTTGTVQLKALFPNPKRLLWPGTFVNIDLIVRIVPNGLTVPTDAVQQGAAGPFAFVLGPDNKVAAHQVQVAQRERGRALISQGLQAGQSVVEQGQYRLVDGTVVVSSKPDQVANASAATSGLLP